MPTTIARPTPTVTQSTPGWADAHETAGGITSYVRTALTRVTASPDGTDEAPYPVRLELAEHHDDEGYVEGPFVNVYVHDTATAYTVEQARALRAALTELITAHDLGTAFPSPRQAVLA